MKGVSMVNKDRIPSSTDSALGIEDCNALVLADEVEIPYAAVAIGVVHRNPQKISFPGK